MERLTVALFSNRGAAETMRNRLTQAGFDARVAEDTGLQRLWFARKAEGGVSLDVMGDQLERAQSQLQEWDASEGALRDTIRCPQCQSLRVQYPQVARHSLLTNFIMGLAAAFGATEKDYYCEHCHLTWSRKQQIRRSDSPNPPRDSESSTAQPGAEEKRKAA